MGNSPSKVFKMSSGKVKSTQLWDKSKDDLLKQLGELKTELGQLRVQQVASSGSKFSKIHDIRKSIARVLTVINAKQRPACWQRPRSASRTSPSASSPSRPPKYPTHYLQFLE